MPADHPTLEFPAHLSAEHRRLLLDLAARNASEHHTDLLGMVLSGSAGRGIATERSDLDVYVVLTDSGIGNRKTSRSALVDEIPMTLSELEEVPAFGTGGWWFRWSFAWSPVLLDRTGGQLAPALHRQATVTPDEAESILIQHDRLDGWINYAYRALKSDRDGRVLERRLDAAESLPWLLDVVFSLAGRVRPYHKYLPWELRSHPLPDWESDQLLRLVEGTLDGHPQAIRESFGRIDRLCTAFDAERSHPVLRPIIEGWGEELRLLRE